MEAIIDENPVEAIHILTKMTGHLDVNEYLI